MSPLYYWTMLRGTITALVTPFTEKGEVDFEGFGRLLERQLEAGVEGLLVLGTTGEAPALSDAERAEVLKFVKDKVGDKALLVAGTGTNNTSKTVSYTAQAAELGYQFALVVTPYYNKPTQEGLLRHYGAVAREVPDVNIIVYNVPGRTGVKIAPETVERLVKEYPNIVAVKEASGSVDAASALLVREVAVLSGDDSLTVPMISVGASGVISVLSNVLPKETKEMVDAALAGDFKRARELHLRLWPLMKALFAETNPGPVKAALEILGVCGRWVRPPLAEVRPETYRRLEEILESLK